MTKKRDQKFVFQKIMFCLLKKVSINLVMDWMVRRWVWHNWCWLGHRLHWSWRGRRMIRSNWLGVVVGLVWVGG